MESNKDWICTHALIKMRRSNRVRMKNLLALCALLAPALISGCQHYEPLALSPGANAAAFQTRSLNDPALREFVETFSPSAPASWPPVQWNFPTLLLVAFYYHPALDLARAQWGVAKAGVRTAGGRPNPILSAVPGYSLNAPSG